MNPVADLRLQLLKRGANRKSAVHVSIGAPHRDGPHWCCPIRLKGLVGGKEHRIFGVDSWQAMILALRVAETLLKHEVREGGKLFYLGSETSVPKLFANRVRA